MKKKEISGYTDAGRKASHAARKRNNIWRKAKSYREYSLKREKWLRDHVVRPCADYEPRIYRKGTK